MATIPTPATFVAHTAPSAADLNSLRDSANYLLSKPYCLLRRDSDQTIAEDTPTAISLDGEGWDTDAMHSLTTNISRVVCVTPGNYSFRAWVQFASSGFLTGYKAAWCRKTASGGATTLLAQQDNPTTWSSLPTNLSFAGDVALGVGDYLQLLVQHTNGGSGSLHVTAARLGVKWESL